MNLRISIPPLTRVLLALLLVISITSLSLRRTDPRLDFLSLVPQQLIFYPWTVLTASFAEPNPITLILIAGPCILYGGRYFERAWGSMELGKVVLIVAVASNVAASILYVFLYAITRRSSDAYVCDPDFDSGPWAWTLMCEQLSRHPLLHRLTSRLPRRLQATGPRTHGSAVQHPPTPHPR